MLACTDGHLCGGGAPEGGCQVLGEAHCEGRHLVLKLLHNRLQRQHQVLIVYLRSRAAGLESTTLACLQCLTSQSGTHSPACRGCTTRKQSSCRASGHRQKSIRFYLCHEFKYLVQQRRYEALDFADRLLAVGVDEAARCHHRIYPHLVSCTHASCFSLPYASARSIPLRSSDDASQL
jgi:hypothetical protein